MITQMLSPLGDDVSRHLSDEEGAGPCDEIVAPVSTARIRTNNEAHCDLCDLDYGDWRQSQKGNENPCLSKVRDYFKHWLCERERDNAKLEQTGDDDGGDQMRIGERTEFRHRIPEAPTAQRVEELSVRGDAERRRLSSW